MGGKDKSDQIGELLENSRCEYKLRSTPLNIYVMLQIRSTFYKFVQLFIVQYSHINNVVLFDLFLVTLMDGQLYAKMIEQNGQEL